jgi:hypothetical protein
MLNGNQYVTENMYMSLGLFYFEFRDYSTIVITDGVVVLYQYGYKQANSSSSVLQKGTVVNCCGRKRE